MPEFAARVASVRITPSRADDVATVIRVIVEAHDITCDPLVELIDKQVAVRLDLLPLPLTPIETAIAEADDDRSEGNSVLVPSAGRRRNGTRSSERI